MAAAGQPGSQSPAQPISEFSVPAIATLPGWLAGGSPSSGTVFGGGDTTCAQEESPATRPPASLTTARYSSGVVSGDAGHVVEDAERCVVVGAEVVPRRSSPTLRHRNVVWAKVLAVTSALISVRPYAPPSAQYRLDGRSGAVAVDDRRLAPRR